MNSEANSAGERPKLSDYTSGSTATSAGPGAAAAAGASVFMDTPASAVAVAVAAAVSAADSGSDILLLRCLAWFALFTDAESILIGEFLLCGTQLA